MLTALDSNIISALWSGEPTSTGIRQVLKAARYEGALVISAPVYAELQAYPAISPGDFENFMTKTNIAVDFDLGPTVWLESGRAYADYAERRRTAGSGQPKRLLPDFIIGAHALHRADRLFTLDKGRYETAFPKLNLLTL